MNILHISYTDLIGRRFNGYAMNQSADRHACRFPLAVWFKQSQRPDVHNMNQGLSRVLAAPNRILNPLLGSYGFTGPAGFTLPLKPWFREADVIHLHLLQLDHYFSLFSLPGLCRRKPVVWTIHDCWPFTGSCTYPFDCDHWQTGCVTRCPHPDKNRPFRRQMPFLYWRVKKRLYKGLDLHLVAASDWVRQRLEKSPLLGHLPCRVIPFGLDTDVFRPLSKSACRRSLGISLDEHVIAFRGLSIKKDRYKGMKWLHEALAMYRPVKPTTLLVFQDGTDFASLPGYRSVNLGWVDDDRRLAQAMNAADVFVMPSIQESFGLMAAEAMACGTAVVVGEGTALSEVVQAPLGGVTAPRVDAGALADEIGRLLADESRREELGESGRRIALRKYSLDLYVENHVRYYREILEQWKRRGPIG